MALQNGSIIAISSALGSRFVVGFHGRTGLRILASPLASQLMVASILSTMHRCALQNIFFGAVIIVARCVGDDGCARNNEDHQAATALATLNAAMVKTQSGKVLGRICSITMAHENAQKTPTTFLSR
jgi:hypothetical protein